MGASPVSSTDLDMKNKDGAVLVRFSFQSYAPVKLNQAADPVTVGSDTEHPDWSCDGIDPTLDAIVPVFFSVSPGDPARPDIAQEAISVPVVALADYATLNSTSYKAFGLTDVQIASSEAGCERLSRNETPNFGLGQAYDLSKSQTQTHHFYVILKGYYAQSRAGKPDPLKGLAVSLHPDSMKDVARITATPAENASVLVNDTCFQLLTVQLSPDPDRGQSLAPFDPSKCNR